MESALATGNIRGSQKWSGQDLCGVLTGCNVLLPRAHIKRERSRTREDRPLICRALNTSWTYAAVENVSRLR